MHGARRRLGRRQGFLQFLPLSLFLLCSLLNFELIDFCLDLSFEFVGGAFEFVECLSYLAGDLWQLLGPEDQQGQEEEEDRLRKIHGLIIAERVGSGNAA